MSIFGRDLNPHPTHKMSDWRSSVVTLLETSRFGGIRSCENCGGEHARTAAGEAMHEELARPCTEQKKADHD